MKSFNFNFLINNMYSFDPTKSIFSSLNKQPSKTERKAEDYLLNQYQSSTHRLGMRDFKISSQDLISVVKDIKRKQTIMSWQKSDKAIIAQAKMKKAQTKKQFDIDIIKEKCLKQDSLARKLEVQAYLEERNDEVSKMLKKPVKNKSSHLKLLYDKIFSEPCSPRKHSYNPSTSPRGVNCKMAEKISQFFQGPIAKKPISFMNKFTQK